MASAAAKGLWLSEETLTETVQFNIARTHQHGDLVIDLATKPAEFKHGADWEWWFVRGNQTYGIRVQAKRLFPGPRRYPNLLKDGPNPYSQLDKLISVAAKDDMLPLYCFYNFGHVPSDFVHQANPCRHSYRKPSFWGCTLAKPRDVRNAASDRLDRLAGYMQPWHAIVCNLQHVGLLSAVEHFFSQGGDDKPARRKLPERISRLIALSSERRQSEGRKFIDDEYWQSFGEEIPKAVSGIVVYRDARD